MYGRTSNSCVIYFCGHSNFSKFVVLEPEKLRGIMRSWNWSVLPVSVIGVQFV